MASLRSLLSDLAPTPIGNPNTVFYVRNTDTGAGQGGCCCLFTVPDGFTSISFEMWGSGGGGAGARCCERAGTMATGGSYALKTISTVAGCQYRICAGGNTNCGGCCGIQGRANPSYAFDITANSVIGCAVGGTGFVTCHCNTDIRMLAAGGFGAERETSSWCAKEPSGSGSYHMCSVPSWPSGGGTSGRACGGGFCHGQHGSAGVVKVSYQ